MRSKEKIELLKNVREKLKECKPEWLEKNQKGNLSLGVWTVQQILDYATDCVTEWHFTIDEQWREEVSKYDKSSGQWIFDGYVYHVRGTLVIEGLGQRSQYGSKVAIGGKDNQNSSYKSAASDCFKKCASLFGVGQSVYSKIKIEVEEEWIQPQPVQAQQIQQPVQTVLPNGDVQQGEYIWSQAAQQWIHQANYQSGNGGQYPPSGLTEEQQNRQWYHDTMKQHDPQGYEQMRQEVGPSPFEMIQSNTQEPIEYPFENVEPTPTPTTFEATPQGEAVVQRFEATPQPTNVVAISPWEEANNTPSEPSTTEHPWDNKAEPTKQEDPLAHIVANNPWNEPDTMNEMQVFAAHKERLQIKNNQQLLPHIRDYFKDATATLAHITPEILKGFNAYLQHIHA